MNVTLVTALVALAPVCMLVFGSALPSFLQLFGAGCLVVVVLAHLCEALHLFPWMHWGDEHSIGHYLDLWSAVEKCVAVQPSSTWASSRSPCHLLGLQPTRCVNLSFTVQSGTTRAIGGRMTESFPARSGRGEPTHSCRRPRGAGPGHQSWRRAKEMESPRN
jgi:hypothetical protein